jgi:hypothetical protein
MSCDQLPEGGFRCVNIQRRGRDDDPLPAVAVDVAPIVPATAPERARKRRVMVHATVAAVSFAALSVAIAGTVEAGATIVLVACVLIAGAWIFE